jgi:hypothetical protein
MELLGRHRSECKVNVKMNLKNYNEGLRTRSILRRIMKRVFSFEQGNEFPGLRKY